MGYIGGNGDGGHWSTFAQAYGNPLGQSGFLGALGAQQASWQNQYLSALAQANATQFTQAGLAQAFRPRPIEDAGISAGEIIGHRAWRLSRNNDFLHSMTAMSVWSPDEPMFGNPDEGLGVHAFKTQSGVLTCYGDSPLVAIGTILLWGTVIEHELGYRAEFAKIHSVDLVCGVRWSTEWRLLARIRRRYKLSSAT